MLIWQEHAFTNDVDDEVAIASLANVFDFIDIAGRGEGLFGRIREVETKVIGVLIMRIIEEVDGEMPIRGIVLNRLAFSVFRWGGYDGSPTRIFTIVI